MKDIVAFLLLFNCEWAALVLPSNATFFLDGVIYVRPDMLRHEVLVHEGYHQCQYAKAGNKPAKDWAEWKYREDSAKAIELMWLSEHSGSSLGVLKAKDIYGYRKQ